MCVGARGLLVFVRYVHVWVIQDATTNDSETLHGMISIFWLLNSYKHNVTKYPRSDIVHIQGHRN